MSKYGYIYCTTDLEKSTKYIGQKKSDKFIPNYFGSGTIIKNISSKRPKTLRVDLIEWCYNKEELDDKERDWIKAVGLYPLSYNIAEGGCGGGFSGENHPMYGKTGENSPLWGRKLTDETKEKIRKSLKGHKVSKETRQKISDIQKGKSRKPHSLETRKKLSEAKKINPPWNKGIKLSEEYRKKISEASKLRWQKLKKNGLIKLNKRKINEFI